MNTTLSSIFLRLDVNMCNLTSKAIAQIIVKIIYSNESPMSKRDIKESLANINDCKHLNDAEIDAILESLTEKEIKLDKGKYHMSSAKRRSIDASIQESDLRKKQIIDKYFLRLNTRFDVIHEWLTEVTIKFFEVYSEEWISDLTAKTHHITSSRDSIFSLVTNFTNNFKQIDTEDKKILPIRFLEFVCASDKIVEEFLWEYGVAAFASKLIRTKHGVDKFTLETFRGSHCILDTNILMFIALESRYKDAFVAIEKVFSDLDITCQILKITQKEYENKIEYQRNITLHNLEKYGYDIMSLANDDFTRAALAMHCDDEQDFERFFDVSLSIPTYLHDRVPINILDDNMGMLEAIEEASYDDNLKNELSESFKRVAKREKSKSALCHDAGMIGGVTFLRKDDATKEKKYFILSEEISVNQYSKSHGFVKELPLALRVDTLINLLAVNNGGDTFDAADYMPLFANIIRMGLMPHKETFRQTELYQLYQMNQKIASLPVENTKHIVYEMHRRFTDGVEEGELLRDLNDMVTKGEIEAKHLLAKAEDELYHLNKQRSYEEEQKRLAISALKSEIEARVIEDFDNATRSIRTKFWIVMPIILLILTGIVLFCIYKLSDNPSFGTTLVISILVDVVLGFLSNNLYLSKIIKDRTDSRSKNIEKETQQRLALRIQSAQINDGKFSD